MSRTQHGFGKALVGAALALSVALPLGAVAGGVPTDVIYNFTGGPDGAGPSAGLIRDAAGNFYGTTGGGGSGHGIVFRLSPLGAATTLYKFSGGSDGATPEGKLIADAAGNLYGTTVLGGAHDLGVVFKLTPGGVETVLHAFAGGSDGQYLHTGLVMDAAGNLYGTTSGGGGGSDLGGTVFKVAPDGTETVLHAFTCGSDGCDLQSGLIMDKTGALYGTAFSGGAGFGEGTIFKIAAGGNFSVLYTFTGHADGSSPVGVIMDRQGALYGATALGGGPCNCGVVFKLAPDGAETVLHTFTGRPDGDTPLSSLIMDKEGNLFGTTEIGGGLNKGVVFQLSPDGTETVLHSFAGNHDVPRDGKKPKGSLILDMNKLYGTTSLGGTGSVCPVGCGVVFEVRKAK